MKPTTTVSAETYTLQEFAEAFDLRLEDVRLVAVVELDEGVYDDDTERVTVDGWLQLRAHFYGGVDPREQ